jgi:type IX secretion system substrate protein
MKTIFRSIMVLSLVVTLLLIGNADTIAQVSTEMSAEKLYVKATDETSALETFYMENGKLKQGRELLGRFTLLFNKFMAEAASQYYYLPEHGLSFCDMRYTTEKDAVKFFMSTEDYDEFMDIANIFIKDMAGNEKVAPNTYELMVYLKSYFPFAQPLNYTKLEMFYDFTGYLSPEIYAIDGLDPFSKYRILQGLPTTKSIIRLKDLSLGVTKENDKCLPPDRERVLTIDNVVDENPFSIVSFPNPTRDNLTIKYELQEESDVSITIYDRLGRTMAILKNMQKEPAGVHTTDWNCMSEEDGLLKGLFLVSIRINGQTSDSKVLIF